MNCMECARPWGVIFDRAKMVTQTDIENAHEELVQLVACEMDYFDYDDYDRKDPACLAFMAELRRTVPVKVVEIVRVTEALCRVAEERHGSEVSEPGWYEVSDVDIPGYLLKGRARRTAVRWDCCNMTIPSIPELADA